VALTPGHVGGIGAASALWDWTQLRIDFGYRSEHVMSIAAKAIATAFYGESPRYSYFQGCSNGGRQALMEAQRYPNDFDGIIARTRSLPSPIEWGIRNVECSREP